MLILTCKLGNEIINCYDGTHDKEQLKKWASKKILLCPVCGKPYEYCHGKVKTPYFRHMDKNECEYRFSESETEEHLNGKRDLFEWIKKQNGITNVVLEGWIPETKQRPDIMFEYGGKKYVIEYQCSPISSEYYERHELYKACDITDIWICGTEKYLQKYHNGKGYKRFNILEEECGLYYSPQYYLFFCSKKLLDDIVPFKKTITVSSLNNIKHDLFNILHDKTKLICYFLDDLEFTENGICFDKKKYESEILEYFDKLENMKNYLFQTIQQVCKTQTELSYVKLSDDNYKIIDNKWSSNVQEVFFDIENNVHENINWESFCVNKMDECIKYILSKRAFLDTLGNYKKEFEGKINGDYIVYYKDFGNGQYIDIDYNNYCIRFVWNKTTIETFIHDSFAYMRKNYKVFESIKYKNHAELIEIIINNSNVIYNNNTKVRNTLNTLCKNYSNKNWKIDYTISTFNIAELKLFPIDDKCDMWECACSLKINANQDKQIDLEKLTEKELLEHIKNIVCKKLRYFFNTGIKKYYTSNERLICISYGGK